MPGRPHRAAHGPPAPAAGPGPRRPAPVRRPRHRTVSTRPGAAAPPPAGRVPPAAHMRRRHRAPAKPLYRFRLRLTLGDHEAAEDLLQETMLRAWRRLDVLPVDIQVVRPWLFTVARNIAIDSARARQARPVEIGTDDVTWVSAPDAVEGMLTAQAVREALLKLSPEHRT